MDIEDFDNGKERIYAQYMGISVEELEELDYSEGDETSADGLTYYLWIQLHPNNDPDLVARLQHLDGDIVRFPVHLFETHDPD